MKAQIIDFSSVKFEAIPEKTTIVELAKELGVSTTTVRHHVFHRRLQYVKENEKTIFCKEHVVTWLKSLRVKKDGGK
jgi:predicted transcriptional regulator